MTLAVLEEHLKKISAHLIRARRRDDGELLIHYLRQAGCEPGELPVNRLFMKAVQIYHPDLLKVYWDEGQQILERDGLEAYQRWKARYEPVQDDLAVLPRVAALFNPEVEEDEEEEELFTESWGPDAEEDDESDCLQGTDFLAALKKDQFGTLEIYPSLTDLEDLDGALDLSGWDIVNLEGVEYCLGLESLHLSANKISDITPLGALVDLKGLDLSDNLIKDAGVLANLKALKELDLSTNRITDITFLLKLPHLESVNLLDNPVDDLTLLARLRDRGVMVIF